MEKINLEPRPMIDESLEEYKLTNQQLLQQHEIRIQFLSRGCIVLVGCKSTDYKGYHNYPVGYQVLSNGLPVLFVNAGGDWECPICFCIYYDGKTLRGYVPTHGNVFNVKEKCAYGSEDDPEEYMDTVLPEGDPEKIKEDIINHIKI